LGQLKTQLRVGLWGSIRYRGEARTSSETWHVTTTYVLCLISFLLLLFFVGTFDGSDMQHGRDTWCDSASSHQVFLEFSLLFPHLAVVREDVYILIY